MTKSARVDRLRAWTRVVCFILCAAVWVASIPAASGCLVSAETVDELTAQKADYATQQDELEALRDETAATLEEQKEQAEILQQQIAVKSKEITVNEQLISTLDTQIADKTASIAEQEATIAALSDKIAAQYAALQQRLRAISKKSTVQTTLQLLLSSRNYRDYLIGFKLSERIAEHDQALMNALESDMAVIEQTKAQAKTDKDALESERTVLADAQADVQADKDSLQQLYQEADALADEMAQDVAYLDEQIAILDEEQSYLQSKIDEVMARLEAEEQAKQEAEQEQDSEDSEDEDTSDEDSSSDEGNDSSSASSEWIWPAPTCRVITSSYKYRPQFDRWHYGLDIACYGDAEGEPIVAAADGTVVYTNRYDTWGGGYGLYMMIDHGYNDDGERVLSLYAHCSEVTAYEGLEVEAGDTIGYIGDTGNSFGAHLHFEVQIDGEAVDPVSYGYVSTWDIDVLG